MTRGPATPDAFAPDDPAFLADPWPAYALLQREAPVSWHAPSGLWLVARLADVEALLRDRRMLRVFTPRVPEERFAVWNALNARAMLDLEGADHARQRRLVSAVFSARRVEALRPRVAALAAGLLDAAPVEDGVLDVVTALAEPLPVAVIAELLGVPEADRPLLRPWSAAIVGLYELAPGEEAAEAAVTAAAEFDSCLRDLVAHRRRHPGDDLLSALVGVVDAGDRLSEDELVAVAVLLLNAGHEATVNAIGNAVRGLLDHPEALARLREEPGLLPGAVEELLRHDGPLSLFQRTAAEEVVVGAGDDAVTVGAGERVGLLLAAAGRDPDAVDAPHAVRLARPRVPHAAFGGGSHYCLGAPLARVELGEALAALLARAPGLAPAGEGLRRPGFQFRGWRHLPVSTG